MAWLDKRNKQQDGSDMARVYFARSVDRGATFGKNVDATLGQPYPICHCCRVAIDPDMSQGISIAFRNDIHDLRDIFVIRSKSHGAEFTAPVAIEQTHWMYPSCPMDGPSIATDRSNTFHAAWMTMSGSIVGPKFGVAEKDDCKVLYTRQAAGASSPEAPTFLAAGHHPRLTVARSGDPCVVYHQNSGVYLSTISGGLHGKISSLQLAEGKGTPGYPAIVPSADGGVICAWQEKSASNSIQIYTMRLSAAQINGSRQLARSTVSLQRQDERRQRLQK